LGKSNPELVKRLTLYVARIMRAMMPTKPGVAGFKSTNSAAQKSDTTTTTARRIEIVIIKDRTI